MVEEVEFDDDIDIEVGRDGRGFEGGAEDFMDVEEDVSRNSGGGIWSSAQGTDAAWMMYLWCSMNACHESRILLSAFPL